MYAIAYLPNPDLTTEAVGPFHSLEKAIAAADAIEAATEGREFNTAPSVVRLLSLPEVLTRFAEESA